MDPGTSYYTAVMVPSDRRSRKQRSRRDPVARELGQAQADIMNVLWRRAAGASVPELHEEIRSLLLPLKAIVLKVLSVAASYGTLVVVFQWWLGQAVLGWIPIFLFAILFGLSMDYEVFVVSRMREAWDGGLETGRAVGAGLARTGPVISAAG